MHLDEVHCVLDALESRDLGFWVLGGWGVDALVGRETREHRDLDLAVDAGQWDESLAAVASLGYVVETDWWPIRVELVSAAGWVDLHPVVFDDSGDGVQAGPVGTSYAYPREHLVTGTLGEREVPCISAAWQLQAHEGYEPRPQDVHDIGLLDELVSPGRPGSLPARPGS